MVPLPGKFSFSGTRSSAQPHLIFGNHSALHFTQSIHRLQKKIKKGQQHYPCALSLSLSYLFFGFLLFDFSKCADLC